jgi:hypothetical protein
LCTWVASLFSIEIDLLIRKEKKRVPSFYTEVKLSNADLVRKCRCQLIY